jgi:predicted nucleotidyltransferase
MRYDDFRVWNFVEQLSSRVGSTWPNIDAAWRQTVALRQQLAELESFSSEDASVVVFGSVGRGEVTESSDVDWTLLIDGPSDPNHAYLVTRIRGRLKDLELAEPGRTETFGVMAFSHELIHHIAGTHDTNQNLRR